jgi:hypothetical protein
MSFLAVVQPQQQVIVTIPNGVAAGQQFQAMVPGGHLIQVQVPVGKVAGETLQVSYELGAVMPAATAGVYMAPAPVPSGQILYTAHTGDGVCCSDKQWMTQFPSQLAGRISAQEWQEKIINANRANAGVTSSVICNPLALLVIILTCAVGIFCFTPCIESKWEKVDKEIQELFATTQLRAKVRQETLELELI